MWEIIFFCDQNWILEGIGDWQVIGGRSHGSVQLSMLSKHAVTNSDFFPQMIVTFKRAKKEQNRDTREQYQGECARCVPLCSACVITVDTEIPAAPSN